jgi:hypothetical protein
MKPDPNAVTSRQQFAAFVEALREDLKENPAEWENATLERLLSALSSYAEDVPGYLKNAGLSMSPESASWQLFAILLCGARVYE